MEPIIHKLTEAMDGHTPPPPDSGQKQGPPGAAGQTPQEVAEMTRREQESQNNGKNDLDRENHMVQIGRGQQTHG